MGKKKAAASGRQLARRGGETAVAPKRLLADLRKLIDESRQSVARTVNTALVWLYWNIGTRIREDVLKQKRAEYGEQIVSAVSRQLSDQYGRGFGKRNLFRMVRFAEVFPDERIVSSLMTQLSWTHFIYIIPLDDPLKRDFYAEMCRVERWSVRTLQKKISGMLAIDLKLGEFEAGDKGQMELYLRWLERHEQQPVGNGLRAAPRVAIGVECENPERHGVRSLQVI